MCPQMGITSVDSAAASLSGHRCLFRAFLNDRKTHGLCRDAACRAGWQQNGLGASGRRSRCDCCAARGHRLGRRPHRCQRVLRPHDTSSAGLWILQPSLLTRISMCPKCTSIVMSTCSTPDLLMIYQRPETSEPISSSSRAKPTEEFPADSVSG
jgi:hypothetical protein